MPDLCKLMTSTFIMFRSLSLLYQTAIFFFFFFFLLFFNWRIFKNEIIRDFVTQKAMQLLPRLDVPHLPNQSRSVGGTLISGNKRGCSWCLVTAGGRVFLSTESTIEYIIVACTIGLVVKVSRIWLAYGWTIYIYNILKRKANEKCGVSFGPRIYIHVYDAVEVRIISPSNEMTWWSVLWFF